MKPDPYMRWKDDLRAFARGVQEQRLQRIADGLKGPLTCVAVIDLVAECYGLTTADLRRHDRPHDLRHARRAACVICSRVVSTSTVKIGRALHRDHSTIGYHLAASALPDFDWAPVHAIEAMILSIRSAGKVFMLPKYGT